MNTPKKSTKTAARIEWEQLTFDRLDRLEAGMAEVRADLEQLRALLPLLWDQAGTGSGIYDYVTGRELTAQECPPEGQHLTAWIVCPSVATEDLTLVDLRTVPNTVLSDLYDEMLAAGDEALAAILRERLQ